MAFFDVTYILTTLDGAPKEPNVIYRLIKNPIKKDHIVWIIPVIWKIPIKSIKSIHL